MTTEKKNSISPSSISAERIVANRIPFAQLAAGQITVRPSTVDDIGKEGIKGPDGKAYVVVDKKVV